ncbi:asparaginase [Coccidioides immitis RS]|uniref:Asparaginase n=1 Tax=Coccidioides immitis (strain RS) TaxID=246410 RepID=J3KIL9_COCIM|nr:asparaginase [Coccidioides immitis RS]EAS35821.3 asparaginase [Coccidioides immitis RS]
MTIPSSPTASRKARSHGAKPRFKPAIILHGGAGNIERSRIPPELYEQYRASMLAYLRSSYSLLKGKNDGSKKPCGRGVDCGGDEEEYAGCSALDAAVHAVSLMEDDPLFNCGRGSVFTTAGSIEMEASLMVCSVVPPSSSGDGKDTEDEIDIARIKRGAGVMMVRNVRNPIRLAKEVLLRNGYDEDAGGGGSMHCQLCGPYVEKLASDWGLEFKPDEWFWTKRRWDEHRRGLQGPKVEATIDHDAEMDLTSHDGDKYLSQGTVGAVCIDQWGNIAVATSTGGLTNKFPGRIGDTPTLGAGFWAEDWDESDQEMSNDGDRPGRRRRRRRRAAAVSGTGNGDSFLRVAAARTTTAMARFSSGHVSLDEALTAVCGPGGELQRSAGDRWGKTGEATAGMIGIEVEWDGDGNKSLLKGKTSFDFNAGGMFRAWIEEGPDGEDRERMMVFREEYYQ